MANQLREWIQNDVITPLGAKAGLTGTLNASQVKNTILSLPDTNELQNFIKGLIGRTEIDLTIPSFVTTIGEYAFVQSNIESIVIPDSVTSIGASAFTQCSNLESVTLSNNITELPNTVFSSCTGLKEITLPNNLITIGNSVFYACRNLQNIVIPNSVTTIGTKCFYDCINLKTVNLSSNIETLSDGCFQRCTSLEEIVFPQGIKIIGGSSFRGCSKLKNINISSSVTTIGEYAFSETGVESIVIPDNVTSIVQYAFTSCPNLTSITLSNNLTTLTNSLLFNCTSLKNITLPSNITNFESRSLSCGSSSNKTTFIFGHITPPTITSSTFTPSIINRIYVPKGTSANYKSATNWSNLATYIYEPNTITFNVDNSLLNNENVLYSIDNGEEQQFTQASFTGENLATLTVTSKTADIVVKVGTTQGGSEIGTVANASTTFTFESDTTIYITKQ